MQPTNYKLTIQYDGTELHGWQTQDVIQHNRNAPLRTVQGDLERALALIEGHAVVVHGAGRTDKGVHAEGQVASVKLSAQLSCNRLQAAINANIKDDIRIISVDLVDDKFHARLSARGKTYVYRVLNTSVASPFWSRYALRESRHLDINAMDAAAQLFPGKHDWSAFSQLHIDVRSRVRTIRSISVERVSDARAQCELILITVTADGFLRYMVRSIAGALLAVGRGAATAAQIAHAISDAERPLSFVTAPAKGLALVSVEYD